MKYRIFEDTIARRNLNKSFNNNNNDNTKKALVVKIPLDRIPKKMSERIIRNKDKTVIYKQLDRKFEELLLTFEAFEKQMSNK